MKPPGEMVAGGERRGSARGGTMTTGAAGTGAAWLPAQIVSGERGNIGYAPEQRN
jgi:hypothetical protein